VLNLGLEATVKAFKVGSMVLCCVIFLTRQRKAREEADHYICQPDEADEMNYEHMDDNASLNLDGVACQC
jgi:hypothetical protein